MRVGRLITHLEKKDNIRHLKLYLYSWRGEGSLIKAGNTDSIRWKIRIKWYHIKAKRLFKSQGHRFLTINDNAAALPLKHSLLFSIYIHIPLFALWQGYMLRYCIWQWHWKDKWYCRASDSPQGTARSPRQLLLLQLQLRSSGGRPSGGRRHSPPPRAGPRSPLEGADQKPLGGTLPAPQAGFSDPELEDG